MLFGKEIVQKDMSDDPQAQALLKAMGAKPVTRETTYGFVMVAREVDGVLQVFDVGNKPLGELAKVNPNLSKKVESDALCVIKPPSMKK